MTVWPSHGIQETPVKKRPNVKIQHCHPEPALDGNKENVETKTGAVVDGLKGSGVEQEVSIYKSLGWDDDIDELA